MTSQISAVFGEFRQVFEMEKRMVFFSLYVAQIFSVRSGIVITGARLNSFCNFMKYYSCLVSLNVYFKFNAAETDISIKYKVKVTHRFSFF